MKTLSKRNRDRKFQEWQFIVCRLARLRTVVLPPQWVRDTIAANETRKRQLEAELWPGQYGTAV